jgi:hypothetical protein
VLAEKQAEYEQRHRQAMDAYRSGSPSAGVCPYIICTYAACFPPRG